MRLLAPLGADRARLDDALAGVRAGGATNLSGGWLKGLEQLAAVPEVASRTILLLTDGLANVGVTDPPTLVALAAASRRDGVRTATVGVGDGFDEELLTTMADAGGGNAHFAATPDAAPGIFSRELDGLARVVGQNLSVKLRPSRDVQVLGVLDDLPAVAVPGGVQLQAGDLVAGERRRIVAELHIPHLAALGPATVCEVVVRHVTLGEEVAHRELRLPVVVNAVSAAEAARTAPDPEVRERVLLLRAARARDEAIRHADQADWEGARRALASVAPLVAAAAPAGAEGDALRAEADALLADADVVGEGAWSPMTRKRMHFRSHGAKRERG